MDRTVPSWLITLVVIAGLATAACFGLFLHYHTRIAAATEQANALRVRITNDLKPREAALREAIDSASEDITARRAMLAQLDEIDDEETATITMLLGNEDKAVAAITSALEQRLKDLQAANERAKRARLDLIQQQQDALEAERAAADQLVRRRAKINERQQELAALKRRHRDDVLGLEAVVKDRRERKQELVDRRDDADVTMAADGTILSANASDGFVIINRGLEQDLPEGLHFMVYNRQGGRIVVKGEVEVIDVEANWATARVITESDPNNPIIPGDQIHNPIYNPDEQKVYVIAGDFQRFSHRELRRFIEQAGGKVEPEITKTTHYLVAGDGIEDILEEASLNGVIILSEQKLLDQLRAEERFQVRRGMVFAMVGDFTIADAGDIRSWIERSGGTVVGSMQNDVDVLLAGENAAEAISQARLQGATIILQNQLVHLMGSDRPAPAE